MRRLQLTRMALNRSQANGAFVGDRCPQCEQSRRPGVIGVYTTKRNHKSGIVTRYLECKTCGWKPDNNKIVDQDPSFVRDVRGQQMLEFDDEED